MDQVSLPMRIALLAVLAFAGLWFVALRPKPADTPPVPAPAPAGVTSAPAKAEKAVATANDKTAKTEAAAKAGAKADAAAPAPAKPAAEKAEAAPAKAVDVPAGPAASPGTKASGSAKTRDESSKVKRVLADIADRKVVVLLFWDRRSSDDREVYRAAEQADRHDGAVSVRAAPIQRLGDYAEITKGLPVASPSVIVIDKQKRATVISGLTVTEEIDAAVKRAIKRK